MLIVPPFMLQLGWVHVRVLSTREGQWGLFGGLWVCIIVNHPLTEPGVPTKKKHLISANLSIHLPMHLKPLTGLEAGGRGYLITGLVI